MPMQPDWSENEIKVLRELVAQRTPVAIIASTLGRSTPAVNCKKFALNLRNPATIWTPPTERRCTLCGIVKPVNYNDSNLSAFSIHRKGERAGKPDSWCKECTRARNNADDKRKEYARAHRPQLARNNAMWRQRHPEREVECRRKWRKNNPHKLCEKEGRRRARLRGAPIIEAIDRLAIIERDKSTCYLCGKVLEPHQVTLDHVIPLCRGGSHTADNLKVACRSCNCRKHSKLLSEL